MRANKKPRRSVSAGPKVEVYINLVAAAVITAVIAISVMIVIMAVVIMTVMILRRCAQLGSQLLIFRRGRHVGEHVAGLRLGDQGGRRRAA